VPATHQPLDPPDRLLCGPGPANVEPAVVAAMQRPMLGHMDPDLQDILAEVVALLEAVYRRSEGLTLPLSGTGTAGMEAGIANLTEPGDTVIVGASGYFGFCIQELARRYGANLVAVNADWGEVVANERLLEALEEHPDARLLAIVHAETSTGVAHPLRELAEAMSGSETLLMADCVTSLGAIELEPAQWGIDYCYSCTQKGLANPPGMSPISVSERALERIRRRIAPVGFYLDITLLEQYWIERPAAYHHTAPILNIYALHEGLRLMLEEGVEARWKRHAEAGAHFQRRVREGGLELLADPGHQLPQLTAIRVPEGMDEKEVQMRLLQEHDIEVGGGLGPTAPSIWRVGLMGPNATTATADRVIDAFEAVLADAGTPPSP